ncbi:hypothetical protein XHV734_1180 [Xanthomonas hortorum pv. vitians]|nr:hypothetical protein XHV734_1180 [Xanthomonas hortorum pv. vitians]
MHRLGGAAARPRAARLRAGSGACAGAADRQARSAARAGWQPGAELAAAADLGVADPDHYQLSGWRRPQERWLSGYRRLHVCRIDAMHVLQESEGITCRSAAAYKPIPHPPSAGFVRVLRSLRGACARTSVGHAASTSM